MLRSVPLRFTGKLFAEYILAARLCPQGAHRLGGETTDEETLAGSVLETFAGPSRGPKGAGSDEFHLAGRWGLWKLPTGADV